MQECVDDESSKCELRDVQMGLGEVDHDVVLVFRKEFTMKI